MGVKDERPWPTFARGRPITARQLARTLCQYGIVSNTIRFPTSRGKGYELIKFEDAFSRYLPPDPLFKRDMVTSLENKAFSLNSIRDAAEAVTDEKVQETSEKQALARCHAKNGGEGDAEVFT